MNVKSGPVGPRWPSAGVMKVEKSTRRSKLGRPSGPTLRVLVCSLNLRPECGTKAEPSPNWTLFLMSTGDFSWELLAALRSRFVCGSFVLRDLGGSEDSRQGFVNSLRPAVRAISQSLQAQPTRAPVPESAMASGP
ncbi:uncharacterized protein PGTG_17784 [Puccinia graminis f. sp. tritici CRL 75-36-700-3]|uniref:Uncharacterized protein n=1 Tax=Puccinia graminis f. sp. tritici (strain CRL 75-36-700-3 / race SCCL) TaxID=418459 RepID=E3L5F9_PUCGT|nr:uncharacterized protein PGTG_17784 [Puccinia graminis f. sp. tritici CRL 75-36-700-3]EFP91784.2 hypothetical protein PGTG_17784 [Puccinia graminis f. sp. tritici CRL 75-36-700-3]